MRWLIALILLPALFGISSCSSSTESKGGENSNVLPTLSSIQAEVFNRSCAFSDCHGGTTFPNLSPGMSHTSLVGKASQQKPGEILVNPGNASDSYLIKKLKGFDIVGSPMPRNSAPLSNAVIDTIAKWINLGAQNN